MVFFSWVSQDNSFPKPPLIELWGQMLIDRVEVMGYRDWEAVSVGPNSCLNILSEGLSAHTEPVLKGSGRSPGGGEGDCTEVFPYHLRPKR